MKLQTKLLIPLFVPVLLLTAYARFDWLPTMVDYVRDKEVGHLKAHLNSVSKGLVPLLLENQLANVYDNLDSVLEQNQDWVGLSLYDPEGSLLYPLFEPTVKEKGEARLKLEQEIGYLDHSLGKLILIIDISDDIAAVRSQQQKMTTAFLIAMTALMLAVYLIVHWLIHRPLRQLSDASNQLAQGDFNALLPAARSDEVGSLVRSFASMRESIQLFQEHLKKEVNSHKITADALYQEKERVSYHATHDALTGLINRREFENRVRTALQEARDRNSHHALLYMDLDQFKVVNDTCGHVAGDSLLRQLGALLVHKVRENDTLSRLGGDEFGVLLRHCPLDRAVSVARELQEAVQDFHFNWQDNVFKVGASIGVVAITNASEDIESVLSAADTACYAAKDKGRNRVHVYEPDDRELAQRHGEMRWVARLNKALDEDRFVMFQQPIVRSIHTSQEEYTELLIRMRGESGGLVPPGAFLPAAERYDLMGRIDRWVIDHSFSYIARLPEPEKKSRKRIFGINLSGASISDDNFFAYVADCFARYEVDPSRVCFELTESTAVSDLSYAIRFITELKNFGCRFALDDFGRGVSSFAFLRNLHVDYLKIDGVFVKDIDEDPVDLAMVKSINEIGHLMGMKTIAEFVEREAIANKLVEIGVDYLQGVWIAQPAPLTDIVDDVQNAGMAN